MKDWINKYFTKEELDSIRKKISGIEKNTSGEVRVSFHERRGFRERKLSPHQIALNTFHSLGMHKTKHKTGVLVFILFGERYFDIVTDEGINNKIPDPIWKEIEQTITEEFKKGNFANTILDLLSEIGAVLSREFPKDSDDTNELSDEVDIK